MGGSTSKEEVVIAQTAGAGTNLARTQQMHETTNTILVVISTILAIGLILIFYKLYKRCHAKQIERKLDQMTLRRYSSLLKRAQAQVAFQQPQFDKPEAIV